MIRDFVSGRKSRNSIELLVNYIHMCYNEEKKPQRAFCVDFKNDQHNTL